MNLSTGQWQGDGTDKDRCCCAQASRAASRDVHARLCDAARSHQ